MSIAVLRGLAARSLRNGNLSSHPVTPRQLLRLPPSSTRRHLIHSSLRLALKPEDHQPWRRQAVASLNRREDTLGVPYNPAPTSRSGLITSECYAEKSMYPRIPLDPLPEVDIAETTKTLDSTRPAPINVPTQKPDQGKVSYYISVGRTYYAFYKTGVKNIWSNWKEFSEIKGWIQPFTIVACARYGGGQWETNKTDPTTGAKQLIPIPHIYRREFQLYYRTKHDLWKLLPFSLILIIFGEWTPLVILAFGNRVVPYTCRIPAQTRQSIDKTLERFKIWKIEMRNLTKHSVPSPTHALDFSTPRLEHPFKRDLLFAYLVSQTNISRPVLPLMSSLYFYTILQGRLRKYWERTFCDTILIRREGGFSALSPQDIYEYASNYGLISLLVIMEREVGRNKNYDFINEELKEKLVPILEKEADAMFQDDFQRLKPDVHWARAYRDTARWASSPDVLAAVELMRENEALRKEGESGDEIGTEEWRKKSVEKWNQGSK